MDTTYFGRRFGVMVLFDSISGQALSVTEVKTETNALYAREIGSLKAKGIEIQSIICDGRKGIPQTFPDIPVQLCHFHQVQTVRRYLTRNPKTEAGKELWQLALTLKNSRRADFESSLKTWFERHQDFFNERTKNPETGQSRYTHPRLRSAYFSLKRNLDSLFVFGQYPELGIPNTTNLLDGTFSDMKRLLRCHQGMSKDGRIRFIKDYFSMSDAESHLFCYLANISSQTAPFLLLTPKRKSILSILSFSYKRTIVQNKNFLPKQKIADQYLSSQISRRETNDLLRTQFRPKNMV